MKTSWKIFGAMMFALVGLAALLASCSKDQSGKVPAGQQNVSLYLSDDPGLFDKVLIDIQSVRVLVDTSSADSTDHHRHDCDFDDNRDTSVVWENLSIRPGVYDLLSLRNGTDTLLASGNIPQGKIRRIKITLGPDNSLVKDSVTYPLHLFPGDSVLTIKLVGNEFDEYLAGHMQLWLDFNIGKSIIRVRDGQFYLRPYIRLFVTKATGAIAGIVTPWDAYPVISVYNDKDTAYAIPWADGRFKVRGLDPGTYTVFVNASNGYQDTTITGVTVTAREVNELGKITLHK
ncbi:MAG TPA: DUF4382 domain-containing protein [Chitinophagaceae bacterium]|nr:DUF4382 domain-containing protein [Chitinophagaceae bacterium]